MPDAFFGARILIVDDELANVVLLERMLARAGYSSVSSTQDSRQFFDLFDSVCPDLILLDLLMPHLDGYSILEQLAAKVDERVFLPVLVLTADVTSQALQRALSLGAKDFLTKPFDQTELLLRVRNLLQTRYLYLGLQQNLDHLENLNLDTQRSLRVRDESISTISHDIGQPLAAMRFTTEVLHELAKSSEESIGRQITANLDRIDSASRQMVGMISELSDLAKLQMGRELTLQKTSVDLVALAKGQAALQGNAAQRRRIKVKSATKSATGRWDEVRLERVISNLLSNAVKFSPKGGDIALTITKTPESVMLAVQDRGIGIPSEDLQHVFEPFFRARNAAGQIGGTGIGLASARQIVEQHGGSISVESEQGQGTTVRLSLPLN